MRRTLLLACALALPAAAQAATSPQLRLVDQSPVQVAGTGFHRGERVTVRVAVTNDDAFSRTVVASAAGRITVRFPGHSITGCAGFALSAVGSAGSRVARKIPIPPACGIVIAQ